jgi:hypothetical protein
MSEPIRRRYADYLAEEARAAPIPLAVPEGRPRPGHGTVFILPGSPPGQPARADGWEARWIDEYDEPGVHGELAGLSHSKARVQRSSPGPAHSPHGHE